MSCVLCYCYFLYGWDDIFLCVPEMIVFTFTANPFLHKQSGVCGKISMDVSSVYSLSEPCIMSTLVSSVLECLFSLIL
jgi:hypothetical protein